jgi:tight adherence protein C
MNSQTMFLLSICGAVALGAYVVIQAFLGDSESKKLRQRLKDTPDPDKQKADSTAEKAQRDSILKKVTEKAAEPFMPNSREQLSSLRRQLAMAGIYAPSAAKLVTGFKFISLLAGIGVGFLAGTLLGGDTMNMALGFSLGGLLGYLVPKMWLRMAIKKNQKALTHGLPDALDLMVVCVEAGLTVDTAMQRIGQEMQLAHPAISREFDIAHMETRVGLARIEALKNLGIRAGNEALMSLGNMLAQAERFGTSIAQALRVHSDSLRVRRQQAAEEMAAKASVKMSFPLVLFIFPATFIVLAGPTVIGLLNSALFKE